MTNKNKEQRTANIMPNRKKPSSKKALRGGTFRAFCYSVCFGKLNMLFSDMIVKGVQYIKPEGDLFLDQKRT